MSKAEAETGEKLREQFEKWAQGMLTTEQKAWAWAGWRGHSEITQAQPDSVDLRDAAIQYTEQSPPRWAVEGNMYYKANEVRGMLADFAGHMIIETSQAGIGKYGACRLKCSQCGLNTRDDDHPFIYCVCEDKEVTDQRPGTVCAFCGSGVVCEHGKCDACEACKKCILRDEI